MDLTVLCIPCHELFHSALAIETNGLFTTALVEPIKLKKGIDEIL